jgi:amino acid permease
VACANLYTEWILLTSGIRSLRMDYNELIETYMGKKMVVFYDINNFILCIGCLLSYQMSVYGFAQDLGYDWFGIEKTQTEKLIIMLFCFLLIQMPLSLLKNISTLQYASITGTMALLYSILVIVFEMPFYLKNYLAEGNSIPVFEPVTINWLDSFSTFMFGFAAHNGIFQVFNELKRPTQRRYYKILVRSFIIEIVLYTSIAYFGYFSTFEKTPGIFLQRPKLPGFNDVPMAIAKVALFICLHCTMAINYNIMRMSIKSMWFSDKDITFKLDFIITFFTYLTCNVIVFFVKEILDIVGVLGGFSTVVICFINPIMIYLKVSFPESIKFSKQTALPWILMTVMTILGTAATIKSFYSTIYNIIHGES